MAKRGWAGVALYIFLPGAWATLAGSPPHWANHIATPACWEWRATGGYLVSETEQVYRANEAANINYWGPDIQGLGFWAFFRGND